MPLLRCLFMMLQARRNDGRLAPRSVAQQRACLVENILRLFGRASGLPHATMAKGAQKRIASTNARAVQTLALGFAISNTLYVLAQLVRYRSPRWPAAVLVPYLLTEAVAAGLAWQLVGMARHGADLAQAGLTAYMFDIVYITWFVHGTTALVSRHFWWTYLVVRTASSHRSPCMPCTCSTRTSSRHTCSDAVARRRRPHTTRRPPPATSRR